MKQEIDKYQRGICSDGLCVGLSWCIYRLIFILILTYGHELWVMTHKTRSRVQAAEISFLSRVANPNPRDPTLDGGSQKCIYGFDLSSNEM